MLEDFYQLVPAHLRARSGSIFYSGRRAFTDPAQVYILGLNPGGEVVDRPDLHGMTVESHTQGLLAKASLEWSEFIDSGWGKDAPGASYVQRRVRYVMDELGLDLRQVPASNAIFVRTRSEEEIGKEKTRLLEDCWPLHEAVIQRLDVQLVVCMGGTVGGWVRRKLGAGALLDRDQERNGRRWKSTLHANERGQLVATVPHPSRMKWDCEESNPSPLLKRALASL